MNRLARPSNPREARPHRAAGNGVGKVTFRANNRGTEDEHELVVIRTDLAPGALPVTSEGAVDEDGAGIEVIGEIEEFGVGETRNQTFDLSRGSYVLICNIVHTEDDEAEVHYQMGMRTAFTVT